jgi:hypothetical protein
MKFFSPVLSYLPSDKKRAFKNEFIFEIQIVFMNRINNIWDQLESRRLEF